jgi:hypothetical protein
MQFDADKILAALECVDHYHDNDQIMLTTRHLPSGGGSEYLLDGVGPLPPNSNEFDWNRIIPLFRNTYLWDVYQEVSKHYKIGRVRMMRMLPGKCYSLHSDPTKRLHIVLKTNPHVVFFDGDLYNYKMEEPGSSYVLDTTQIHTAANFGKQTREHLVFVIDD